MVFKDILETLDQTFIDDMEDQLLTSWDRIVEKLQNWWDVAVLSLPNVVLAFVVFFVAYWLSKILKRNLQKLLGRVVLQPAIRNLLITVCSILIMLVGLFLALGILNLDSFLKSLLAGAGVAGIAISLAIQGTLANTFSGIFLAFRDDVNLGDFVETNGFSGVIVDINLRNVKLREVDNNMVMIPNKLIVDSPMKNYGLTKEIRTTIACGVHYDSDLQEVEKVVKRTIRDLYPDQNPDRIEFFYTKFSESSIDFILRFWHDGTNQMSALTVKSAAIKAIKRAFQQHDISIPYPIRTIIQSP